MIKEIREHTEWEKKLSQLLWEYMEEKKKNPEWFLDISTALMAGFKATDAYMISKQFWFIEWLVKKDKIDTKNLITYMNWTSLTFNKVPSTDCTGIDKTWYKFYTEVLLMLLSIQDEPVKFLYEILKDE